MNGISLYLEKFKTIGLKEEVFSEKVFGILCDLFGKDSLNKKDVTLKNGVIHINVSGPLRSEIYIHKKLLLEKIQEKTRLKIIDVR